MKVGIFGAILDMVLKKTFCYFIYSVHRFRVIYHFCGESW